jgi:hypothetical protein
VLQLPLLFRYRHQHCDPHLPSIRQPYAAVAPAAAAAALLLLSLLRSLNRHLSRAYQFLNNVTFVGHGSGFVETLAASQRPGLESKEAWYQGTADAVRRWAVAVWCGVAWCDVVSGHRRRSAQVGGSSTIFIACWSMLAVGLGCLRSSWHDRCMGCCAWVCFAFLGVFAVMIAPCFASRCKYQGGERACCMMHQLLLACAAMCCALTAALSPAVVQTACGP